MRNDVFSEIHGFDQSERQPAEVVVNTTRVPTQKSLCIDPIKVFNCFQCGIHCYSQMVQSQELIQHSLNLLCIIKSGCFSGWCCMYDLREPVATVVVCVLALGVEPEAGSCIPLTPERIWRIHFRELIVAWGGIQKDLHPELTSCQ